MAGSVYSTSERNYETFNKIQAKSSFGRHFGGQEYALQHRLRVVSLFSWSVEQIARDTPLPPTWRPIQIILVVWKNQRAIEYLP